jgi:hypothetical protein
MVAVPELIPINSPVDASMAALALLLLVHVPPIALLLSCTVSPGHNDVAPVIADAAGFTVITRVTKQPVELFL